MKLAILLMVFVAVASARTSDAPHSIDGAMRALEKRLTCDAAELATRIGADCALSFVNRLGDFATFCASSCARTVLKAHRDCGVPLERSEQQCARNQAGVRCLTITNDIAAQEANISLACLSSGSLPDPLVCRDGCAAVMTNSNAEIGCCINTLNTTDFGVNTGIPTVLGNRLWMECGVTPPGLCSAAAVVQFSLLLAALMVLVAAVLA